MKKYYDYGMFRKGTKTKHGIIRQVHKSGHIYECMAINGKFCGYGRDLYTKTQYYMGMNKDNNREGEGMFVYTSGKVEQGLWEKGKFKG